MAEYDLDSLYREAQSALKSRDYARASELLRQILVVDENYKDVSRLLAQTVKLKRRRWYNHPFLWWAVIGLVVIGLMTCIILNLPQRTSAVPVPPTLSFTSTALPTETLVPTITPSPMPTEIPLTWKRLSMGQEFPRDTVTAFATDKNDPDVIYAAMENAGVYKTIDGGLSWHPTHNGLASTQVVSLLIDSQTPQILYAGTMDGIFKTEDGGENWFRIGDGTYLLMDYQDGSHLYARDKNGIYETNDQGNTWTTAHPLYKDCPSTILAWAIHPADGNTLLVGGGEGCETGLYQSNDGGHSWVWVQMDEESPIYIDRLLIGLDKQGNSSVYVGYHLVETLPMQLYQLGGFAVSYDKGVTWNSAGDADFNAAGTDPNNSPHIISGGASGIWMTQGKGHPWHRIGLRTTAPAAIHVDHHDGAERIIVGGSRFANYYDEGIFISTSNGTSWSNYKNGFGATRAELKLSPIDHSVMYLAGYYAGIYSSCALYRSLDNGKNWFEIYRSADWCGPAFDVAHVLYLNDGGRLQKSWDGGETWHWDTHDPKWMPYNPNTGITIDHTLVFSLPSPAIRGAESISANPYVDDLVYDIGDVINYSTNAGADWQLSIGSEGSEDGRLFYTDQGKMIFAIGRYQQKYSTDNGKTWQACAENLATSHSDSRLALDKQGSRLYLATPGQGVLVSMDKCGSWQPSNNGLTNLFVNTLAIDPNNDNTIYAGTDGGAYISYDGGVNWEQVNDGLLGATVVYSIAVDKESNVYAATPYGIFKLEGK